MNLKSKWKIVNSCENYIEVNKNTWNEKVAVHVQSEFYDVEQFIAGSTTLNNIELKLLGDVQGKTILHLQCHFGQDTISLARLGATVVGVDFSDKAIAKATELATTTNTENIRFICCDIYNLPTHLQQKFDIVYTSYGTIGWLPDVQKWANIVQQYLKPLGKFVFVEFHPAMWMFDNDFNNITYSYFTAEAIVEDETGTYADTTAAITTQSITWNHGLAEVFNSLQHEGLQINQFNEYDYSPYNCLAGMEEYEPKKFRIKKFENKIPLLYSITAIKPI